MLSLNGYRMSYRTNCSECSELGDSFETSMADPPASTRSKSEIVAAGKILATDPDPFCAETIEAFRLAHVWRASHVHPMRRVRSELALRARKLEVSGVAVARLKRMHSIRKKLARGNRTLYQIQDIGGCRIILKDLASANRLIGFFEGGGGSRPPPKPNNYIAAPKPGGYRCYHGIFKFNGMSDDPAYQRHFIEAQIRTQLQYAWATAVEAVGLFRNEDLKGGAGNGDWLRLFELVSSEFAEIEGGGAVPGVALDCDQRRAELCQLVGELDALKTLDGIREAISYSEKVYAPGARFFLIEYDYERRRVHILPQAYIPTGLEDYQAAEMKDSLNTVLVEVDKLTDLKDAYPNYFLDVGEFTAHLRKITGPLPSISGWRPNFAWLRDWKTR
jgi:Region found in RelA / SpoT proteins